MDMDRYIGRMLDDRYEILEVIGSGGMAVVYKALCHRLNRLVALKVLKDENLQDEDFRRRFHAEGQAVAMLSHPNIVSVYDVSTADDADYIVMELIDGITLKQYMERKGVLNWKETLHFAIQIAKALEHAHSRGLVHRDIKPHNVMVLKNGSVKVADFGIAQVMTQSDTLTKEALGSVHYISPEQAKGGRVDHRSDLYSLGVVMYEMIAGRPPFDGDTPVSVAIQHINGGAEKPSVFNPNIPEGLEQIIMRAMSHDMADRYATATAMLYDMDELRKDPAALFPYQRTERITGSLTPVVTTGVGDETIKVGGADQQKVEQKPAEKKKPSRRTERTKEPEDEERSRITVIAIVACSVVALLAILVCMVVLMDVPGPIRRIQVPGLVGQYFDQLPNYDGMVIVQQSPEYSKEYAKGQIIRQEPEGGTYHDEGTVVYVVVSLGEEPPASTMVDLVGLDAVQARKYLEDLNIGLYILPREEHSEQYKSGLITRTKPADGEPLRRGETVILWVSIGPKIVKAKMPNLLAGSGMRMDTAELILNKNGFFNLQWVPVDHTAARGTVLSQSVAANVEVDVNTLIVLEYSTGNVPNTSDPTDPLTEPTTLSTITKTFTLPDSAEEYILRIELDGITVQPDIQIMPGTAQWTATLTGSGIQTCTVYINGEIYEIVEVDFEADE
jgi:serine/threonine-protein kinase